MADGHWTIVPFESHGLADRGGCGARAGFEIKQAAVTHSVCALSQCVERKGKSTVFESGVLEVHPSIHGGKPFHCYATVSCIKRPYMDSCACGDSADPFERRSGL